MKKVKVSKKSKNPGFLFSPDENLSKIAALSALASRKANPPEKVDNASLYAGSPMYYYCQSCGHLAEVLPECHTERPKSFCKKCQEMKDKGWI